MADDYLASLSAQEVANFYRRLASFIKTKVGTDSLASILLLHWLDGKGANKGFPAKYVRNFSEVQSYLVDTARPIFLSKKVTPAGSLGGVVPRIKGTIKSNPAAGPYPMHLEGNVETPLSVQAKLFMGMDVDKQELDALYGLHGFTMICDVVASATPTQRKGRYAIKFQKWTCKVSDQYHWNPKKHIEVPNPDYGSAAAGAVQPKDQWITVYHSNAIRVEKAGLAQPFHDESEPWDETSNFQVAGDTVVDI